MSKTIRITRTFSVFALLLMGVSSVSASEVTGTLSSGLGGNSSGGGSHSSATLVNPPSANTLGGTVTNGNSNSSGGGSNGNTGAGQVLGLSTSNSPAFPNTGYDPGDGDDEEDYNVWGTLMVLAAVGSLFTLGASRYQKSVT